MAARHQAVKKDAQKSTCMFKQLQKTRLCTHHLRGTCQFGDTCAFAHTSEEIESSPDLRKTRLCKAYAAGKCENPNCGFAHGTEELRSTDACYKRALCVWHGKGRCRNGEQCRFAHGVNDLRQGVVGQTEAVAGPAASVRVPEEPMFVRQVASLDAPAALGAAVPSPTAPPAPNPTVVPVELLDPIAMGYHDSVVPSFGDFLTPVIVRAVESAQDRLDDLSDLGGSNDGVVAQTELRQFSQNVHALHEQLTLLGNQLQQRMDIIAEDEEKQVWYPQKPNSFGSPCADYPPVGYGFSPYLASHNASATASPWIC